ncbi:hypothetical protein KDN32_17380 [Nocardioides sp. J2M5]|uniref:hypothetical protein n=1 Tax=Nocardioides palaemonis TaxID=2829810 RepID=UPI001BA52CF1|nr:hypothetical protein [Nocardioides palaemonis]MBS2939517.1 hypothetical protein [Nocardioides palaemonis]
MLDGAEGASEVLGLLDDRFYELEGTQDADSALGHLADEFSPWPGAEASKAKRGFWPQKSN